MKKRPSSPQARRPRTKTLPKVVAVAGFAPDSIVTRTSALMEPGQRHLRIAEAAYFRAERRHFDPGHDLDDWLTAEAEIDAAMADHEAPNLCGDTDEQHHHDPAP